MQTLPERLLAALAYPRSPSDFLELVDPLHSAREIRARVVRVIRETHDVTTLVLQPNRNWRGHRAGQHVLLTAEIAGVRRTRCFSIASAEGAPLAITIKARPGGAVTPAIVAGALDGRIVTLSPPTGDFVLPDALPRRILFLSGGSGITPVMSMFRTLRARGYDGELTFLHYARTPADVIYAEELARMGAEIHTGFFSPDHVRDRTIDTFACGPEPFLDAVRAAIAPLRTERFALPAPSGSDQTVTFTRSNKRATGKGPLLQIAEGAGLRPASGCRMGICKTCVCRKVSGVTRDLRTGAISTDGDVDVQLCISEPVGPVEIEL